ncbi:MAG TPA: asparagine synthase (glutamine-hydrolyzing) [Vicinamibacteria bacterium]
MCGIAGLIHCGDPKTLELMTRIQAHRGPDDSGLEWFAATGSGLGHRRLSIIDLSPAGHQPMPNDNRRLWITYNGEIYNHVEVRGELEHAGYTFRSRSDTEVIVKAYEAWGVQALDRLNGMFAFAIYDSEKDELFAARDRLGIKPFYYHQAGDRLVFASEIKAILASGLAPREADLPALHTPARFQVSPHTGFAHIAKLPPGHYLQFRNGRLDTRPYWSVKTGARFQGTDAEALERLDALLQDSVRLQMIADVPVGVLLSGGLDSSLISALMKRSTAEVVHSFTIKFTTQDQQFEKMPDDSVYAALVARRLGFVHHEREIRPDVVDLLPRMVWHLDEPLADPAAINTYLLAQMARDEGVVVMLNGVGGDEVFGGYRKFLACLQADTYQRLVPALLRRGLEALADGLPVATSQQGFRYLRWAKRFLSFASRPPFERFLVSDLSLSPQLYRELMSGGPRYEETPYYRAQAREFHAAEGSYLDRMCLSDTLFFLPELNLLYSDKASMAASIEGRPPLIDHRLVELAFTLPDHLRIQGGVQKLALKKVAERYLPRSIVHRPKAPFGSPLRAWIRGPLAEMVGDLLSDDALRRRGLYRPERVRQLVARDKSGQEDNAHVIWTLLTNEIWHRTFIDADPATPASLADSWTSPLSAAKRATSAQEPASLDQRDAGQQGEERN